MTGRIGVVEWSLARCRVKVLKVCFLRRLALVNDDVPQGLSAKLAGCGVNSPRRHPGCQVSSSCL